jgi:hypothetical protein
MQQFGKLRPMAAKLAIGPNRSGGDLMPHDWQRRIRDGQGKPDDKHSMKKSNGLFDTGGA